MEVLLGLILLAVIAFILVGTTEIKEVAEYPSDYRCNGHYIWDKPDNNGRTDRDSHHAEGNAYRVNEHTHY